MLNPGSLETFKRFLEGHLMLSQEDKEKCVELYYWATKKNSAAQDWNEEAANLLAELYTEMAKCSSAIDFIPRPPSSKPGWVIYLHMYTKLLKRKCLEIVESMTCAVQFGQPNT